MQKQKNYIYGCADLCAFSKGQNPFWSLGAKVEARSLIRNKAHLLRGGGEGSSAREVGSSGLLNTHYHLRVSLCPACPSGHGSANRSNQQSPEPLGFG